MAFPRAVTRFNKAVLNKGMIHLAGHGPFVELEHVGRRSGRTYRIPVNAFRHGDELTFALTYGPDVDWLRNVRAAQGCRVRMHGEWLTLAAPRDLTTEEGMARMPGLARTVLGVARVDHFVAMPVRQTAPA
ncbi:nitroreductase family deazaflavin-dependent oxidoreductase [Phycicoccus endophyticus]|uniref:Nitroreductase family deazaflavin-dependent oxidoreductase n=1 Tax=Phycicoccus endophyticus TaxID=1690220 RepID=A0A7G9R4K9_9MICO|nr:nitroreductase family deazaflavin-dependent oxidoreductase [Phycicoccus endophyticus]NHI18426.1 nitroreductase family deazaflavin-dependent oxidoreductase [Phycicoccus endophyticus]QNN50534.1 nitroreductase family deazaflavin-dependent oxidoreductase [Phycicoccus endophyticus]GGL23899.1 nitroreductase [Phycicoccus endophyticus]